MRITDAAVLVCSPGRNFVTLRIRTDDGLEGIGDATLNGRELAVVAALRDHVNPLLLGRDPHRIEDIWQFLHRGVYWRRGPVGAAAIAAVDTALWDIKAKAAGMPLYQLLGGRCRDGVLAYVHATGRDIAEAVDAVGAALGQGFRAVRAQAAVPGLARSYGVASGGGAYEPAGRGLPVEEGWDSAPYLRHAPALFEALRAAHGPAPLLLHDAHHRLRPVEAARLGRDLEPFRLFWLEDATPAEDNAAFRLIRQHTTTPLAIGEVFNGLPDCRALIAERLIDYLRCSVTHAGGVTGLRKLAFFADAHDVRLGPHGASDLSPVAMGASLHLALATHNAAIHEWMPHPPEADAVFGRAWHARDGLLHPGDAPGHGVTYDEREAARHPYQPAYLPVARLAVDGTMWDW